MISPPLSAEASLVIALSRTQNPAHGGERIEALLSRPIEWELLQTEAAARRVEPMVFVNLVSGYRDYMPAEISLRLASRGRDVRARTVGKTLALLDIVARLKLASIPVAVLKGPAIGIVGYGDVSLRTFADFDFLIHRENLAAARDLLVDLGYRPGYDRADEGRLVADQHALEFSNGRHKVELHWSLLSKYLRFDMGADGIWDNLQAIDCLGSGILTLEPAHLMLFHCAHGAKHEWGIFRWICDTAQLASALDARSAARVVDLAAQYHGRRLLAIAIRLASDTFGEEYAGFPAVSLVPGTRTRLAPLLLRRIHPGLPHLLFWAASRERLRDRVFCVLQLAYHFLRRRARA